jgi:divalent metal cation (Fe/Co/Zn/Cd) transporter
MELAFAPDRTADQIEAAVDRLEKQIREAHSDVAYIFIETESLTRRKQSEEVAG